eukprot:3963989-Pyramimonas_sp.AAC.1
MNLEPVVTVGVDARTICKYLQDETRPFSKIRSVILYPHERGAAAIKVGHGRLGPRVVTTKT